MGVLPGTSISLIYSYFRGCTVVSRGSSGGPTLGFNLVLMLNFNPPKRIQLQSINQVFIIGKEQRQLYPKHV